MPSQCPIHKKYKGKKKPTNECPTCLQVYFSRLRTQAPPPEKKNQVIPDKSKYNKKKERQKKYNK